MRYRLRTLLIVLALGPPVLWGVFALWQRYEAWRDSRPPVVIRVPAMGPRPAFDFAFPVASQDSLETEETKAEQARQAAEAERQAVFSFYFGATR